MADQKSNLRFPSATHLFPWRGRRAWLRAAGGMALLAAFPPMLKAWFMKTLAVRTVENNSFAFENGMIYWRAKKTREPYALILEGLIQNKARVAYSELQQLPQVTQTSDFHCVEGWSVEELAWGGIRFSEILKIAQPLPEAQHILFHALGETETAPQGQAHYIECLPIRHLLDPNKACLLALRLNGRSLPPEHGAPLRVVAPYDLGYKSIKFVYKMEFVRTAKPGWWTLANPIYPMHAPVPASRLK